MNMSNVLDAVSPKDFPTGKWHACWIGKPRDESQRGAESLFGLTGDLQRDESDVLFRKTFILDKVPRNVPTRITADSRYILWVNGMEVSGGPVRSQPRRLHYDYFNLSEYLKNGENIIAVRVRYYGKPTSWWMPARANMSLGNEACLVFEAKLDNDDWLISDNTWKVLPGDAWSPVPKGFMAPAPIESFDARRLSAEWNLQKFDDSSWENAKAFEILHMGASGSHNPPSDPYGPLLPRPIPQLEGETRKASVIRVSIAKGTDTTGQPNPVEVMKSLEKTDVLESIEVKTLPLKIDPPHEGIPLVTFDFGEEVSGIMGIDVEASAGTRFDVAVAESLTDKGCLQYAMQESGFRYIARGNNDQFETMDSFGCRFVRIAIQGAKSSVTMCNLTMKERLYPRPDGAFFECSDPLLNRIFEAGLRTVALTSHDAYVDCPSREQRAWVGDSVVHQMVHLATNPDWGLAVWNVQLGNSPRYDGILPMAIAGESEYGETTTIPDWSLHWIHALRNLYRYTGDKELVLSLLPTAEDILRWFLPFRDSDGLLKDVTEWVLIDWSSFFVHGKSSLLNALWARGLLEFAEMAEWVGDKGSTVWARNLWKDIKKGFGKFWDEKRKVYVDQIMLEKQERPVSQLAGAIAVCAGLVPSKRVQKVIDVIADRERLVRTSFLDSIGDMENLMEGMAALVTGVRPVKWDVENKIVESQPFMKYTVHDAVALAGKAYMIPELCRDWEIFLKRGDKTFGETWSGGSHCHGWSSTPTRDLIIYTLGVTPDRPGFASVRIAPRLGSLEWARGAVPTPHGFVKVNVDMKKIEVDSPVPITIEPGDGSTSHFPSGTHTIKLK